MLGLMMDRPLLLSGVLEHAERVHGDQEIVTRLADGDDHVHTVVDLARRARQLASALTRSGVGVGDRVATLAFNTHRHLEVFFGATGMGAVCHPINTRLPIDELAHVVDHAGDRIVFYDPAFGALVDEVCRRVKVERWVALDHEGYEGLMRAGDPRFRWPEFDERVASALCYTSGTTGSPRGVLSSHRSMVLHSLASLTPDSFGFSGRDTLLSAAPIFHVNAWGFPVSALMTGARLVLPGPNVDPVSLLGLANATSVTVAVGSPTLWDQLLEFLRLSGQRPRTVRRLFAGGSAVAASLIEAFEVEYGIEVTQGWGMTETGPIAAACTLKAGMESLHPSVRASIKAKQGRPVFGVEVRIVDENGAELPWDGVSTGELLVRGPWVASGYYAEWSVFPTDGWFATGDIARVDPDGYITVTDRLGDVIKSGGEWISSVELEHAAMAHPGVRAAAAIAMPDARWGERPMLVVTAWSDPPPEVDGVIARMAEFVPRWWLPDRVEFVAELPVGSTGKVLKRRLRDALLRPPTSGTTMSD